MSQLIYLEMSLGDFYKKKEVFTVYDQPLEIIQEIEFSPTNEDFSLTIDSFFIKANKC